MATTTNDPPAMVKEAALAPPLRLVKGPGARPALRLLLTSAGRRVELIRCFRAAGTELGVEITVFACDRSPDMSAACHEADRAFAVPSATDPSYTEAVWDVCRNHSVDLLVPTIDPELLPLSLAVSEFAAIGTCVSISAPAVVEIARDKLHTAEFLAAHDIPAPQTFTAEEALRRAGKLDWPMLAKPRHGSSGRRVQVVSDAKALAAHAVGEPFVAQGLLHGSEFTVNMFFDASGVLRCAVPHERLQVRAGEVAKGVTRRMPALEAIARHIAAALPDARGALCFQAMVAPDGGISVFEINARFGGGYPLAHAAGASFVRWLIEEEAHLVSTAHNGWREGVLMLRYDAAQFVQV